MTSTSTPSPSACRFSDSAVVGRLPRANWPIAPCAGTVASVEQQGCQRAFLRRAAGRNGAGSESQIRLLHVLALLQRGARTVENDAAVFQHVGAMGERQCARDVLLDEQ